MSNPKILLPLIGLVMACLFCGVMQYNFEAQRDNRETIGELLDLSQVQAQDIGKQADAIRIQAEAIKVQAESQAQTIENQHELLEAQSSTLQAGTCIIGGLAAALVLLALVLFLKQSGSKAPNSYPTGHKGTVK